jgi:hypothetical protein
MAAAKPTRRAKSSTSGALFFRLKKQVKADYNSKGEVNWRRKAPRVIPAPCNRRAASAVSDTGPFSSVEPLSGQW